VGVAATSSCGRPDVPWGRRHTFGPRSLTSAGRAAAPSRKPRCAWSGAGNSCAASRSSRTTLWADRLCVAGNLVNDASWTSSRDAVLDVLWRRSGNYTVRRSLVRRRRERGATRARLRGVGRAGFFVHRACAVRRIEGSAEHVVVGAGLAGLATVLRLACRHRSVTVLARDAAPAAGRDGSAAAATGSAPVRPCPPRPAHAGHPSPPSAWTSRQLAAKVVEPDPGEHAVVVTRQGRPAAARSAAESQAVLPAD
jgi:hypothetical protein